MGICALYRGTWKGLGCSMGFSLIVQTVNPRPSYEVGTAGLIMVCAPALGGFRV